jgi:hypothetical protein
MSLLLVIDLIVVLAREMSLQRGNIAAGVTPCYFLPTSQ